MSANIEELTKKALEALTLEIGKRGADLAIIDPLKDKILEASRKGLLFWEIGAILRDNNVVVDDCLIEGLLSDEEDEFSQLEGIILCNHLKALFIRADIKPEEREVALALIDKKNIPASGLNSLIEDLKSMFATVRCSKVD